ncbi:unnamed protein product, partial [Discosporangium mesarthrocarpum]
MQVKILQKHLRLVVNQLRKGVVLPRDHSNLVRKKLRECGWHGGPSSQEDASELFTFLMCLLRSPSLPLSEALFHGGKSDAGDSRVSTERALHLALPKEEDPAPPRPKKSPPPMGSTAAALVRGMSPSTSPLRARSPKDGQGVGLQSVALSSGGLAEPGAGAGGGVGGARVGARSVTLEEILMHNFHDNRVMGLHRKVSGDKDTQRYQHEPGPPLDAPRENANSPGGATGPARATRSRRSVIVPHRLDFSKFIVSPGGEEGGPGSGRFVLVLRSAVCHLGGEAINKGHYIAYAAD